MKIEAIYNAEGMPLRYGDYQFSWNKDLYKKQILVKKKGAKKVALDLEELDPELPLRIRRALKQLSEGARVFRDEDEETPEAYLSKHRLTHFDDELNKALAQKFGMGFTSALYQYLLEKKPSNLEFKKLVDSNLALGVHNAQEKYTFIIARGYAHTVMGNDLFRFLREDLSAMGYEVILADTDGFGRLEDNEKILIDLFQEQMKLNKKIILIGTCVGLVASVGALEQLKAKTQIMPVEGIINIAGMLRGSFVVDWGTRMPQWFFIKRGLFKEYKSKGGAPEKLSALEAMKDFRFERIGNFMKKVGHAGALAPKTLNLISILPGNGLGRDRSGIRRMQDQVIRPNIKKSSYGSNDGIIEYPHTEMPDKLTQKNLSLVFESSHNFLDGYYNSPEKRFDLRNDEERRLIFGSVLKAFIKS